jgi:hypothetical protein
MDCQHDRRLLRENIREEKLEIVMEQTSPKGLLTMFCCLLLFTAFFSCSEIHLLLLSDMLVFLQLVKDKDKEASFVLKCPGRTLQRHAKCMRG